jgi:small subunit ribosomal protein S7
MPRRKGGVYLREIGVDDKYKSGLVQKFINVVMERGKKSIARSIVYEAIQGLVSKANGDEVAGLSMFEKIINMVKPEVEVKARRVGGGVYQVPTQVRPSRSLALALRWIVLGAKSRSDKTMGKRLSKELLDASEGRGGAIKKRSDVHRMAEANKAFSHYAW